MIGSDGTQQAFVSTGPVPLRALVLSVAALSLPVAGVFLFPETVVEFRVLLWLLALVPALLLAHFRGWRRVSVALAAGMAALTLIYVLAVLSAKAAPDWPVLFFVVGAYIAIALGSGWLTEVHRAVAAGRSAEEALGVSEERYRDLFESSKDAIYVTSVDGELLSHNQAFQELFGYPPEELHVLNVRDTYVDPSARERFQREIEENSELVRHEVRLKKKDGTEIVCLLSSVLRRAEDGSVLGYQGSIHDITERKRAEEALRVSEERFRAIAESAVDGIIECDAGGRILFWNDGARQIFGHSSRETLGRSASFLFSERFKEDYRRFIERAETRAEAPLAGRAVEVDGLRKDGSEVSVELSLSVWKVHGKLRFGGIIRDLTIRKQLEEEMRLAQRMEAVGQVVAGLAHDFRNILTVVGSTADLLSDSLPQEEQDLQEDVEELRKAAHRGKVMVEKLLAFGRLESGEFLPIDLATVVREFEPTFRLLLPENIGIEIISDEGLPLVLADHGSIEQIVMNLATNARDAMSSGGNLIIEISSRSFAEEDREGQRGIQPGDYVYLAVSDTGKGMDAETMERAFEPFFTTKPTGEGTGLGLPVVFGLSKQHGGFVHVYSEPGMGATFRVYLPVTEEEVAAGPEAKAKVEVRGGSETILVVEDDPALSRAARRTLEGIGYTVLTAEHGSQALEILREQGEEVDLVFSDVIMPGMSGPELFNVVRSQGIRVKFIFSSGHSARDVEILTDLDPGLPFVGKPWSRAELAGTVREVLDAIS